jgi:thymidylate kinase
MSARIELVGLCGAGKSTFISAVKNKLKGNDSLSLVYPVAQPLYLTRYYILEILMRAFIRDPVNTFVFFMRKSNWWLLKKLAYRAASNSERYEGNLIVVDSGVLQPFLSFEIEERTSESEVPLCTLLKSVSLPDVVIFFYIPSWQAKERYEYRWLKGEGKEIRENSVKYFDEAEKIRKKIFNYCKMHNTKIIEVDSSKDFTEKYVDEKIVNIVNAIKNLGK